jgi:hypothetical protein
MKNAKEEKTECRELPPLLFGPYRKFIVSKRNPAQRKRPDQTLEPTGRDLPPAPAMDGC